MFHYVKNINKCLLAELYLADRQMKLVSVLLWTETSHLRLSGVQTWLCDGYLTAFRGHQHKHANHLLQV